ncbi:pentapeptide repeat-containing protein [Streptomyces sp. ID05-26A]|nr:pentapeptide repeat-containing protein [Streptomyces sp. ID05-26A]
MSKRMFRLGAVALLALGVALLVPPTAPLPSFSGAMLVLASGALAWLQVRDGQLVDGYRRAVRLLGSDEAELRVDGLHLLEQIAEDSAKSRLLVDVTIGDFLRERSPWTASEHPSRPVGESPAPDVEAALAILTRQPGEALDLSHVDLRGTDLRGVSLREASLRGACLEGADLRAADLTNADLRGADMRADNLDKAALAGARVDRKTIWPPGFTPARVSASLFSD